MTLHSHPLCPIHPADYTWALLVRRQERPSIFNRTGLSCAVPKYVNPHTGEIVRCEKSTCVYCLLVGAGRIVGAIRLSAPTHTFALTGVGTTEKEIKKAVRRWLRVLRRITGHNIQICWSAEPGPRGTNPHVHGFLWASGSVEDADMTTSVEKSHLGREHHFQYREDEMNAEFIAYILKTLAIDDLRHYFLQLNGLANKITLVHFTNDFLRNGEGGEKLTLPEARREAYRQARLARRGQRITPGAPIPDDSSTASSGDHVPSDTSNSNDRAVDLEDFDFIDVPDDDADTPPLPPKGQRHVRYTRADDITERTRANLRLPYM